MRSIGDRKLELVQSAEEGVVLIPFGFTINGTSDPDGLLGDEVDTVTRAEAGEFNVTFKHKAAVCFLADAGLSNTADDVDLYVKCDWSTFTTDGIVKVRAMTGATQTDPTDNTLLGGFLLVRKTSR